MARLLGTNGSRLLLSPIVTCGGVNGRNAYLKQMEPGDIVIYKALLYNTYMNFHENGYELIKNFVSSEILSIVTQYAIFDEIRYKCDKDPFVPGMHTKYSDPIMESLLIFFHEKIEKIINLSLYPTYSCYRIYRTGAELRPHVDRHSCEISATVCFGHSYDKNYSWPIYMKDNPVIMEPGDIVIYKGCEIEHSRLKLELNNSWHVQGFFHYVNVNGRYSDFKFDKRSSLGLNPKSS